MNLKLLQAAAMIAMSELNKRPDTPVKDESEDFHTHLDRCLQCRTQPFALCLTGERLLKRQAGQ